ncbi:hypothetical protein F5B22DRAFT_226550 [Xylaria bambusicola]|uniref:uncharacterized protein n=1 Tax=Xylaria bambusicola TaxID=326684 RepID=UPI0020073B3F|nr:uncharacterized protein F5B22DRAFT_226550 [Xylaria bambusicola]KAI0514668.1 hypothetical protein F5B22DRAFT_226550 [Xylaria bambusicola]
MASYESAGNPLLVGFFNDDATLDTQNRFVNELWPQSSTCVENIMVDAYFNLVRDEKQWANIQHHAVKTYQDIISIVGIVRTHLDLPLQEIASLVSQEVSTFGQDLSKISTSIELAVRLWLMSSIHNRITLDQSILETPLPWADDRSLKSVITDYVNKPSDKAVGRFPKSMNIGDMNRMAGFQFKWTSNLSYHLILKDSTIYLFHNVSVLKRMKALQDFPLPHDYIDETLATISLLIPLNDARCNRWLHEQISAGRVDKHIRYCREEPEHSKLYYGYWQVRLENIEKAFERARPRNIFQWIHDTRDWERWWGFWLIMAGIFLTVFFVLIQSVTGIIQVVKPN